MKSEQQSYVVEMSTGQEWLNWDYGDGQAGQQSPQFSYKIFFGYKRLAKSKKGKNEQFL